MKRNARAIAVTRCRLVSSRGGRSGSGAWASRAANAASISTPPIPAPRIPGEPQPRSGALTSANTISVIPSVAVSAPGRSKRRSRSRSSSGAITQKALTSASPASGTFTKNTDSQPSHCVSAPPSRTPSTNPAAPAPAQTASARLRSSPSGKVVLTSDSVAGKTSAPPSPWTARAASSTAGSPASPPASEEAPYRPSPAMSIRRRPRRSAARPPSRRNPPKATA